MQLHPQSVCQLAFLVLCCVMITVRESDSTFVPGRCVCPDTQMRVIGKLKDLEVLPKSPGCNKITVIVTLVKQSEQVCLDPDGLKGKQLIRCWNRVHKSGRDRKLCLRRRGRRNKAKVIAQ